MNIRKRLKRSIKRKYIFWVNVATIEEIIRQYLIKYDIHD
jgi:hypothetical protein